MNTMRNIFLIFFLRVISFSQDKSVHIDFDHDGTIDIVQGFTRDSSYVVLFISNSDSTTFTFKLNDSNSYNGFCGKDIQLYKELLDYDPKEIFEKNFEGFKQSKTNYGVRIEDGMCDSFHFFWNHKIKHVQMWRL